MLLSDMCALCDAVLVQDAEIATLGFLDQDMAGRLVFAASPKALTAALRAPGVAAILADAGLDRSAVPAGVGLATAARADLAFLNLQRALAESTGFYGERRAAIIDPSSRIAAAAAVSEWNVTIGADVRIAAGAAIEPGSELGPGVAVHANAVIGAEGFQVFRANGLWKSLTHAGGVRLAAEVTIMAGAVVARGVFRQDTRIGEGALVGNGAFVSHNTTIGQRCLIGHGAVVAGNCRIGDGVTIGPGAVILDRLSIGDGAIVTAGSTVARDVAAGERVSGNFAVEHKNFLRDWLRRARA